MKPGTFSRCESRDSQTCSTSASEPLAMRKRFMAIYMLVSCRKRTARPPSLAENDGSCATRKRDCRPALANQSLHWLYHGAVGEHGLGQHALAETEMIHQDAFD